MYAGCGTGSGGWNNTIAVSGDSGICWQQLSGYGFIIGPYYQSSTTGGTRWDSVGNLTNYGSATFSGSLLSTNTTTSTTTTTGAIQTLGGIGVTKDVTIGGSLRVNTNMAIVGEIASSNSNNSTSLTTGSIQTLGGVAITKDAYIGGKLTVGSTITYGGTQTITFTNASTQNYTLTLPLPRIVVLNMLAVNSSVSITITLPILTAINTGIVFSFRNSYGPTSGTSGLTIQCNTGSLYYTNTLNGTAGTTLMQSLILGTTTKVSSSYEIIDGNIFAV
jgi:hypothetical protein